MDQPGAGADHRPAQHQRAEDAPEENAVLIALRHREVGEDQDEDEDVVDRQRLLDEVAGEKLQRRLGAHEAGDGQAEQHRGADPGHRPAGRLAHRDLVRVAVEDAEVDRQHREHGGVEGDPDPDRHVPCVADVRGSVNCAGGRSFNPRNFTTEAGRHGEDTYRWR